MQHAVVSQKEWLAARRTLFEKEFAITHKLDALRAERRAEDLAAGRALYNYGKTVIETSPDMFGVSVFMKDENDDIFHTYSTYHRGTELLMGAFNWLDLAPKGRNENGTMSWVRLHDEYAG